MNNLTFIHTNWTKPALNNRWNVNSNEQIIKNIWYYTLSAAYLKRLNQCIKLYTDNFGKMCLDHIPYDKIYLTLNDIPSNIKTYMWAYGKFWAFKDCSLNTVHIDADVFIKDKKCLDMISNNSYDLLVQCQELNLKTKRVPYNIYEVNVNILSDMSWPEWSGTNIKGAYNTGIVRFNNQIHKDEFLSNYFRCAEECCTNSDLIYNILTKKNLCSSATPDLILEQKFMFDSANKYNLNTKCLIDWDNASKLANEIGYQHVWGKEKYNDNVFKSCMYTLKMIDNELYIKTQNKCKQIYKYLNEKNI